MNVCCVKHGAAHFTNEIIPEMHEGLAAVQLYNDIIADTVASDSKGTDAKAKK